MDRAAKGDLADRLRALAASGVAVLVATHDAEFAAAFAQRVVLLADGRPIADGPIADVLTGGWYFATETARIVGALHPRGGGRAHPPPPDDGGHAVSWELASFALLFCALAAGFLWYERSHPSSKVLALVATLAALAALGRVAFAPLPNVKPTTDIVLLSGYALGGAPGFAVGAAGALASNFFFGQGPWTPWQMAAWGLCGVIGAALAAVAGRRLGRVPLAIACGAAGFLYGAILDFSTWVTFSGSHTLGQFVVYSGTSLPFNVAHAVGNVLFCLAFGPGVRARPAALPRALRGPVRAGRCGQGGDDHRGRRARGRDRVAAVPAPPARAADAATRRATAYVLRAQNRDGGFGAKAGARLGGARDRVVGDGPRRRRPPPVARDRALPRGDRRRACATPATSSARSSPSSPRAARRGARAASTSSTTLTRRRRSDGSFERLVNRTAFAILALRAAGRSTHDGTVRRAASWLAGQQNRDGGWNFAGRGAPSGIDDTAGALQALVGAGRSRRGAVARAAGFITRNQNPDGGFPLQPGSGSNAQSTAWGVQGLVAAGRDPGRVRRGGSRTPLGYLRTLVASNGSVRYSRTSAQTPVWVTAQALTGAGATAVPGACAAAVAGAPPLQTAIGAAVPIPSRPQ